MKSSVGVKDSDILGICYGIAAYTLWGLLPLYWKLLEAVPAVEILAHRILWSFVFMGLIIIASGSGKIFAAVLSDRKKLLLMFLCGFIISANWFTYIYAVNSGFVIEASMGYYINPLVVVLLGVTVLKERLTRWQFIALILAFMGVLIITVQYGRVPWIALVLAITFALYGLIKKIAVVDPETGLLLETAAVTPLALLFIVNLEAGGAGALGTMPLLIGGILAGAGVVTATPLLLFARGIEKTTFSMMGFLQYIAPTLTLFLGVFVFREFFSPAHFISFCFIWVALIIFTLSRIGVLKEPAVYKPEKQEASDRI